MPLRGRAPQPAGRVLSNPPRGGAADTALLPRPRRLPPSGEVAAATGTTIEAAIPGPP